MQLSKQVQMRFLCNKFFYYYNNLNASAMKVDVFATVCSFRKYVTYSQDTRGNNFAILSKCNRKPNQLVAESRSREKWFIIVFSYDDHLTKLFKNLWSKFKGKLKSLICTKTSFASLIKLFMLVAFGTARGALEYLDEDVLLLQFFVELLHR